MFNDLFAGGGGGLVFEIEYHLSKKKKKNHVIRVVFQDQAMYARTSFRGAKTCKLGKKGVFLVILKNFRKDMTDKFREMHAKTCIDGLFLYLKNTCLGCVWKPFYEDDIQPEIQVPPSPGLFDTQVLSYTLCLQLNIPTKRGQTGLENSFSQKYWEATEWPWWVTVGSLWCAITAIMNELSRRWEIDICRFRPIGALVISISTFILIKSTYVDFS